MNFAQIHGVIERRLLVNYRADRVTVEKLLPSRFRPQLVNGHAMVGICLIRLAELRPRFLPAALGLRSENAAHRIAVEWDSPQGRQTGVYVRRRDTSLWLNTLVGGRIFPGVHHRARFNVRESENEVQVGFHSLDDGTSVAVRGKPASQLPSASIFKNLQQSSEFFKGGSIGFSPGFRKNEYQGLQLITDEWKVEPFQVNEVFSSYFESFPKGSVEFDHALLMRNVKHSWRPV